MKTIILTATISLLIAPLKSVNGQAAGNVKYNENLRYQKQNKKPTSDAVITNDAVMIFEVNALKNVKADSYVAIFNITQLGATAESVDSLLNLRYNKFIIEAAKKGIVAENIFLDMISLVPVYEYAVEKKLFSKTYNEVPKGFELQKNLHIRFTKGKILDKLVTIAAKNEIYDLVKVEYIVKEVESVYDELRERAVKLLNKKKISFNKLGINLDTVYHIIAEKSNITYPISRYSSYQAFSRSSIDAIKKKRIKTKKPDKPEALVPSYPQTVKQIRKSNTLYYNQIPYDNYDIVINPEILEPEVQFSYNLKIKYIIKKPDKKIEKHFLHLTPEGNLKTLDVK